MKFWTAACLTAGIIIAATILVMSGHSLNIKLPESMLDNAKQAEQVGQFKQARQLYECGSSGKSRQEIRRLKRVLS